MPAVRELNLREERSGEFMPTETYLLVLTTDENATVCKAALSWNVDKPKALELIINGGMVILREVLPSRAHPRPPELS